MAYPELKQLKSEIEMLEIQREDARRELKQVSRQRDEFEEKLTRSIPISDVHQHLDRLEAPRHWAGRPLLIGERFALVERRLAEEVS